MLLVPTIPVGEGVTELPLFFKEVVLVWLVKKVLEERGLATVDWLVIMAIGGMLAVLAVKTLLPSVRGAHNTVVERITDLAGSGF